MLKRFKEKERKRRDIKKNKKLFLYLYHFLCRPLFLNNTKSRGRNTKLSLNRKKEAEKEDKVKKERIMADTKTTILYFIIHSVLGFVAEVKVKMSFFVVNTHLVNLSLST